MNKITRIKTVMTPFPHWIDADEPLLAARDMMQELHVRHLPVKDRGELVSVVTDRDVKFALDPQLGLPPREAMRVRDICVFSVYTADLERPLFEVLETMAERRIGSALITRNGTLCGIFTATDACHAYGKALRQAQMPASDPDAA
ncbi:MAG: CBS domain-containing protein [Gammaproteobacteria bacterium]